MLWRVNKANTMARVLREFCAGCHRLENARFALDAQVNRNSAALSNKPHQGFGFMGIELIGDEDPLTSGISADRLDNMVSKVLFSSDLMF